MKKITKFILILPLIFLLAVDGLSLGITGEITRGINFLVDFEAPTSFSEAEVNINLGLEISYPFDVIANVSSIGFDEHGVKWKGFEIMPRFDIGYWEIIKYNIIGLYLSYTEPHHHGGEEHNDTKIFKSGIAYFTDIELFEHLFNIELNSTFNFYPDLGLDVEITPNFVLVEIEGTSHIHISLFSTFNIHTHFEGEVSWEISPGLSLDFEPFYFEISYGILNNNISGKLGINIKF